MKWYIFREEKRRSQYILEKGGGNIKYNFN
jgi:hypothetical protein